MSERMTAEAVRVAIEEAGVAEPVFDQVGALPWTRLPHVSVARLPSLCLG